VSLYQTLNNFSIVIGIKQNCKRWKRYYKTSDIYTPGEQILDSIDLYHDPIIDAQ
jgi:hypothetical protein